MMPTLAPPRRQKRGAAAAPSASSSRPRRRSWLDRFRRAEPTTYQRCLAVHVHFATEQNSALR